MKKLLNGLSDLFVEMVFFFIVVVYIMPGTFISTYSVLLEHLDNEIMVASMSVTVTLLFMAFLCRVFYLGSKLDIDFPGKKDKQKVIQTTDSCS